MIRKFITRLINLLIRVGYIKDYWRVGYSGKIFSLNDLYKQGHWSKRSAIKNKYSAIFRELLKEAGVEYSEQYFIIVFFNTKHDTDNIVGVSKVFVDTMREDFAPDDSKKYYKGLLIFPDESIEEGSVEFLILKHG